MTNPPQAGVNPRARWERAATFAVYALLGCVLLMGLKAAVQSRGFVPDYDGLSYVNSALRMHLGLLGAGFDKMSRIIASTGMTWVGLPYTNTLDVLLLALLYDVFDHHVGVWLIHSAYIALFVHLARRILSPGTVLVLFSLAVANAYFLHQYVNLVSEMKVGLLLALFIAYLFHEDIARHRTALFWITALLLFARTINLLFIAPLVVVQVALRWRHRRAEALAALKAVGLAVLVLSPMILYHGVYMVDYMARMGYSDLTQNWRDMTGVYGKRDLLRAYWDGMLAYHKPLSIAFCVALAAGVALTFTRRRPVLRHFRDAALALGVVFAVLMQAQTNNIMVVYWVFILGALCFALLVSAILDERLVVLVGMLLALVALHQSGLNFVRHNQELARARPVMELANALAVRIEAVDRPFLFSNFRGFGAVDEKGFEVILGRTVGWPSVNMLSYSTPLEDYIRAMDSANIALVANRNFMWPSFMGINHKTEQIAEHMANNAAAMGFIKADRLLLDSDPSRYVDVYVRPTVSVKLKYAWFNDKWLDAQTAVVLKAPGGSLDGYALEMEVTVPGVNDPAFAMPVTAALVGPGGERVGSAVVRGAGPAKLSFALDGLAPGAYRLQFDKTFAPAGDPRRLSAMFVDARVRYVRGK